MEELVEELTALKQKIDTEISLLRGDLMWSKDKLRRRMQDIENQAGKGDPVGAVYLLDLPRQFFDLGKSLAQISREIWVRSGSPPKGEFETGPSPVGR